MPAEITIHDVGHGACIAIRSPEGRLTVIDCGHTDDPYWTPTLHYNGKTIDSFVVSNFDEDHLSDFSNFMSAHYATRPTLLTPSLTIGGIAYNSTVTPADLVRMKQEHEMGRGVRAFHDWLTRVNNGTGRGAQSDKGSVNIRHFYNSYPFQWDPSDTNNISLVTVIELGGSKFVTCGDIESDGMHALLLDPNFRNAIAGTNVLVAPHHGRQNGYNREAMNLMNPQLVIFSDSTVQYDTQATSSLYKGHTTGAWVHSPVAGLQERHVLTTRRDGTIKLEFEPDVWRANTSKG
jgi:beta-lactamase superfamily II metal-dependent hydrolase